VGARDVTKAGNPIMRCIMQLYSALAMNDLLCHFIAEIWSEGARAGNRDCMYGMGQVHFLVIANRDSR
jgi:hypothetical protein